MSLCKGTGRAWGPFGGMAGSRHIFVGTAGWSISSRHAGEFAGDGTHLERYCRRLDAVEINSSFYRPHRRETYERWARAVPENFSFSVKLPKSITHERRLIDCGQLLHEFLSQVGGLGAKLGVILVQLPPSLRFDATAAPAFLAGLRSRTEAGLALEPRHESWFDESVNAELEEHRIARVAADPARVAGADRPSGWSGLAYFRLHGSPEIYRSDYAGRLDEISRRLKRAAAPRIWCIFDNTMESHALGNAVALAAMFR